MPGTEAILPTHSVELIPRPDPLSGWRVSGQAPSPIRGLLIALNLKGEYCVSVPFLPEVLLAWVQICSPTSQQPSGTTDVGKKG